MICYATMETRRAQRAYEQRHKRLNWHNGTFSEWADKETERTPYRHDDGVSILVSTEDLQPDDNFLDGKLKRAQMSG